MKKLSWIAAAALVGFAGAVLAQTISVPQVQIINPTDLFLDVVTGVPSAQSKYATAAQITSKMGYSKFSPLTAFSYTFGNSQSMIVLTMSATAAQGTITLAAAPSDGDQNCLYAKSTVTTLNLAVATGQTLDDAVTTIGPLSQVCYLYSLASATWDRSK
jgi:hypothetical protein